MGRSKKYGYDDNPYNLERVGYIKNQQDCKDCAGRIYNNNQFLYYGKGTITTRTMFIIPPHEINKITPVEEGLSEVFKELFNIDIHKVCYITTSIKCPVKDKELIHSCAKEHCYKHLYNEMYIVTPRIVFVVGKDYDYILSEFAVVFPGIKFICIPSPLTKTINPSSFNQLKESLKKYVIL